MFLWTHKKQFWQPWPKFLPESRKIFARYPKMIEKTIFPEKLFLLTEFLRRHRMQFWQPWPKFSLQIRKFFFSKSAKIYVVASFSKKIPHVNYSSVQIECKFKTIAVIFRSNSKNVCLKSGKVNIVKDIFQKVLTPKCFRILTWVFPSVNGETHLSPRQHCSILSWRSQSETFGEGSLKAKSLMLFFASKSWQDENVRNAMKNFRYRFSEKKHPKLPAWLLASRIQPRTL